MEIWKDIDGYGGRYQVSNLGHVRSIDWEERRKDAHGGYATFKYKGKKMSLSTNGNGYVVVQLNKRLEAVHRLVANAFIDKIIDKDMINHINGDKTDNRASNLEWCTNQENQLHASRVLWHKQGAYQNKPVRCVETGEVFENSFRAANEVRYIAGNIRMAANPKSPRKTCMGYHWEFVN